MGESLKNNGVYPSIYPFFNACSWLPAGILMTPAGGRLPETMKVTCVGRVDRLHPSLPSHHASKGSC